LIKRREPRIQRRNEACSRARIQPRQPSQRIVALPFGATEHSTTGRSQRENLPAPVSSVTRTDYKVAFHESVDERRDVRWLHDKANT
jgi:hypothetical protein